MLTTLIESALAGKPTGYSWLTPSGQFYNVFENHGVDAARRLGVPVSQGVAAAMAKGWARITHSGEDLMAHRLNGGTLTGAQLRELKDLAMMLGKSRLILDNDDHNRVLWSEDEI